MERVGHLITAVGVLALVASCSSGSSSQSTTARKAPKRLGEKPAAVVPAAAETPVASAAAADTVAAPATPRILFVNVAAANVRATPSREGAIVTKLKFLDTVTATGALDGEWVEVDVKKADGTTQKAWIHSTLISASREQAEAVKAAAGK
jgi:hypothetical protein